jgi:hypothetical protein
MKKKSFPPPKLKRNKSKTPWAFPLAERKTNSPHSPIKLAWKSIVKVDIGYFPHQIHLERKTSPPTSHQRFYN